MTLSVFDLFKIGIGPSSSHTVGPMRAAYCFTQLLQQKNQLSSVHSLKIELYGSLGSTGKGHAADIAIILGLMGEKADTVNTRKIPDYLHKIRADKTLTLKNHSIFFDEAKHLSFNDEPLDFHPNGMIFRAFDQANIQLISQEYYSIGGGFIVSDHLVDSQSNNPITSTPTLAYPFTSAQQLIDICNTQKITISQLMLANERAWRTENETIEKLLDIWKTMQDCVTNGCQSTGVLPGNLIGVKRRAAQLYQQLNSKKQSTIDDPLKVLDWVNLYALAVNEENAAGGRVVTAPTNGAAGIIPAVLHYYVNFIPHANQQGILCFLLTAAAIGILYKKNASISGAEVGCQGEVGVACSMAAGALCEVLGGTVEQVENAAEIGMEHNLGLTCDPIDGLVQVPCIERNAMGSVKAINAARIALQGDGSHCVSLDKVIKTMHETGIDMQSKYKETSKGGLAVNIIEC
ncbi:UNVERIFIED_CONTAM: hypothetical protein GTU68_062071 [Idotea baltica]|nr:hypothetical protein [Idotea baltica]